jgi:DNA-binding CsgD family transcriptional regulator
MRSNKKKIYDYLFACQKRFGGYTGRDIDEIARIFGFSRRTVKRNVEKLSKTDPTSLIIIDSRGIDSRRKSLFAKRQKRVVRIVERGVTRVSEPNVSFSEAFLIELF